MGGQLRFWLGTACEHEEASKGSVVPLPLLVYLVPSWEGRKEASCTTLFAFTPQPCWREDFRTRKSRSPFFVRLWARLEEQVCVCVCGVFFFSQLLGETFLLWV